MSTVITVVIVVVAIAVIAGLAAGGVLAMRRRTSGQLKRQFGPEYDRTVAQRNDRQQAERELAERQAERRRLDIRELDPARRRVYADQWRSIQIRFVDEPAQAVSAADRLVTELMAERGYPTNDIDRQTATVSVDYPEVIENYRAAHQVSAASDEGRASTEDCRGALVHYRSLFVLLLGDDGQGPDKQGRGEQGHGEQGRTPVADRDRAPAVDETQRDVARTRERR